MMTNLQGRHRPTLTRWDIRWDVQKATSHQPNMPFQCQVPGCTSSYRRKEHLRRHEAQHRGSHLRTCSICERVFSRSDSLRRHIRRDHEDPRQSLARATQACMRCRTTKARCQGGSPCTECSSKGHLCIFDGVLPGIEPAQPDPQEEPWESGGDDDDAINTSLENTARVDHYIHLYFTHFHQHWPFLHQQTFSIPDEPQLLLQAVVMIGLWVSGSAAARQDARNLHSKLGLAISAQRALIRSEIFFQFIVDSQDKWEQSPVEGEDDNEGPGSPNSRWPIGTYQGILLYIIFSLLASSSIGLELNLSLALHVSDRQILSALIATCLRNNIFYYPNMVTRYRNVESVTCMWVGVEEIKRLGLALYKVSRLCGRGSCLGESDETDSRPFRLSDLQFPLPDRRHFWEAASNAELSRRLLVYSKRKDKSDEPRDTNWISQSGVLLETDENWWS
ncbi:hypothetical protein N7447_010005 [Penicillium robsamsonii]|uniref:uncharacterized protein n=1 Tax=Penicillium robsamsonii TaxID=1792511 RepID=UPI0025467074|nr:uncharacterized protein N7447_010005 [Penicillium robsamsonii]KAJ5812982.1 hypothetical protein N7447_010005 [Penicillium robsamsonii]